MRRRTGRVLTSLVGAVALGVGATGCSDGVVAAHHVEREIGELVQQVSGAPADAVSCPEDLPAKVGSWIRCTLTARGVTYGVTARVTSIQQGAANFELKVDDQPRR